MPSHRVPVLAAQELLLSLGTPCLWPAAGRQPEPGSGPALSPARSPRVLLQVVFHDVGVLTDKLFPVVEAMQKHFSAGSGTYYSDSIFFLSVAMHQIMPKGNLRSDVCVCPPGASSASALHPREEPPQGERVGATPLVGPSFLRTLKWGACGWAPLQGQWELCRVVSPDPSRASGLQA